MSEQDDPEWEEASPEVLHTANALIRQHHRHIEALDAKICFVFRKEAQMNKGRAVLGHVEKISEKMKVFQDYDFLIWVSRQDWERMTSEQREALIDHELCHIKLGSNGLSVVGHDFEEFYEIIQRHGLWDQRLKRIEREMIARQEMLGLKLESLFKVGTVSNPANPAD